MSEPFDRQTKPRIRPALQREQSQPVKRRPERSSWRQQLYFNLAKWWQRFQEKLGNLQQRLYFRQIWILNIVDNGLFVWRGRIPAATFYPANEIGLSLFKTWLVSSSHRECRILVDSVAELFVTERIAKLGWLDRQAILERHRQRQFPNKRFSTVISLGVSPQFHQEAILFSALDDHGQVTKWLDALEVNRAPLSGIWSPSLLLPTLLRPLKKLPARCLLLTQHGSELRESYLMYDRVRFSRLVKIQPYALSARCAEEIPILLQYLAAQRWIQTNQALVTYIIVHPSQINLFTEACGRLNGIKLELIDSHKLARYYHLNQLPKDDDVSPLIRHILTFQPSYTQYASRALRFNYYNSCWRQYFRIALVILSLAGLIYSSILTKEAKEFETQTLAISRQYKSQENKQNDFTVDKIPNLPVSIGWMKQVNEKKSAMENRQEKGRELWNNVFRALKSTAGVIIIDQLNWKNDLIEGDFLQLDGHISLLQTGGAREAETAFSLFRQMISNEYVVTVLQSPLQQNRQQNNATEEDKAKFSLTIRASRL